MEQLEKIELTTNALKTQLKNAGIDISVWGTGKTKTIDHLKKEIDEGETILETNESGELIRLLTVAGADIYYMSKDSKQYRLKEEKQIFQDGRKRQRNLGQAISEKIKPNEDPEIAIARGIKEELGIQSGVEISKIGATKNTVESPSYPGLKTEYSIHKFKAVLNDEQFNPNGYTEIQDGLTTYFVWEEIK
ncbi:MAG: hypothetical protein WC229_00610 [Candidatus Paceibacterota bacterium]|jgi:hypothetical protein